MVQIYTEFVKSARYRFIFCYICDEQQLFDNGITLLMLKQMKKFLFIVAALALTASAAVAQPFQNLPNDPAVKVGKLENGLTYYIRHNEKPAGRAEFYLATDVGAIQETPDQDGLAHFLEHMCFNGTKDFPGKGILNWLQGIGASFGGNVNASTGVEQTIYMLNNIPLVRPTVIDTCILIMQNYAHYVNNDLEEINNERGVIIEERRSRRNASWRMHEKSLPYYYGNNKYGSCTLIGSQENLETFKKESIDNFYETWYHPDMQAFIVVGDVDVDYVEGKIKEIFGAIPKKENPQPKATFPFEEFSTPRIGIITDPEATGHNFEILWEMEADPKEFHSTIQCFLFENIKEIISHVANERFNDITSKAGAPFLNGNLGIGNLNRFTEVVMAQVSAKEGETVSALEAFLTEVEKLRRFGITEDEFNRAKDEILSGYESAAKKADTRQNSQLVYPIIYNFFENTPFMDPKQEYELAQMVFGQINYLIINQILPELIKGQNNMVVIYKGPEKEGVTNPTEAEITKVLENVRNAEIKPNVVEELPKSFLDPATLPGSKASAPKDGIYGEKVYTLENGAKVILYKNDIQKDRVLINLSKNGGESLIPTEDIDSFDNTIFGTYVRNTGVAGFSGMTVTKMLAGKNLSISPYISTLRHGVSGNSSTKDVETALQLVYLFYTQPRFDEEEYSQGLKQIEAVLPNLVNQPNYKFQKMMYKALYGDNPRMKLVSPETLEKASLATIEKNYRNLFTDAAGITVQISGDFDVETVLPMVEKYIGSIAKGKKATDFIDRNNDIVPGTRVVDESVDMETPKTTVLRVYSSDTKFDYQKETALDAAEYILFMRYTTSLREEEGGTYGAQAMVDFTFEPKNRAMIEVYFDCKPALADKLREVAERDLKALATEGPTAEEFDMTKKNLAKKIPEQRETISYWAGVVRDYYRYGVDRNKAREAAVEALTSDEIKNIVAEVISSGNFVDIIMRPAKTAEAE